MPKKTGRPPEDDELVFQRMVQLRSANPPKSKRKAAWIGAKELLPGEPSSHVERLRKNYAAREKAGTLPLVESNLDRRRREIQEALVTDGRGKAERREQLAAKEQEAASLGFDTANRHDLSIVLMTLQQEILDCALVLHGPIDIAVDRIRAMGLSAAEGDAQLVALAQRHERLKKVEEVLREIIRLREELRLDRGVSAQKRDDFG